MLDAAGDEGTRIQIFMLDAHMHIFTLDAAGDEGTHMYVYTHTYVRACV